jgi:hypothetical protein
MTIHKCALWALRFMVTAVLSIGCSDDDPAPAPPNEKIEVHKKGTVSEVFTPLDSTAMLTVAADTSTEYRISIGKDDVVNGTAGFYVYDLITWSIVESPDAIPAGMTITIDPLVLTGSLTSSTMTITTPPALSGSVTITLQANRADFAQPKKVKLRITVG